MVPKSTSRWDIVCITLFGEQDESFLTCLVDVVESVGDLLVQPVLEEFGVVLRPLLVILVLVGVVAVLCDDGGRFVGVIVALGLFLHLDLQDDPTLKHSDAGEGMELFLTSSRGLDL